MLGAFASEELYGFGSSYMNEKVVNWYSEAGQEGCNQNNTEKAKQLLEEVGYNGEEITLLSNRDIPYHYDIAMIVQEQLNQLGINVNLEVFDWAAHIERRDDPDYWDIVTAGINYPAVPSTLVSLARNWSGWTDDTKIAGLLEEIISSDSLSEGKEKWYELQGYAWTEYIPFTQFGSVPIIMAAKSSIEGLQVMDRPIMMPLWNTKVNGE